MTKNIDMLYSNMFYIKKCRQFYAQIYYDYFIHIYIFYSQSVMLKMKKKIIHGTAGILK